MTESATAAAAATTPDAPAAADDAALRARHDPVTTPKTLAPPVSAAMASAPNPAPTLAPTGRRADRRLRTPKDAKAGTGPRDEDTAAIWRTWLTLTLSLGAIMGVAWFVLAPGGAIYGEGKDFATWFPRDAALALLLLVAGVLSAVLLLRQGRKNRRVWASGTPTLALLIGGLAGSVLAWRIGVFAGDLFQTVPENLPSPSMIFSLRSPSVLLLWPLASAAVLFLVHFIGYNFARPLEDSSKLAPAHQQSGVAEG